MIEFDGLMETAMARIKPCLPEFHEIDDTRWGDDIFQFDIYDAEKFPRKIVDRFRFSRREDETDDEVMERFDAEVAKYARSWR